MTSVLLLLALVTGPVGAKGLPRAPSSAPLPVGAARARWLPDPHLTPGAAGPMGLHAVCTTSTKDTRHVTARTKRLVCEAYGLPATGPRRCPGPAWELDHVVSLELGGRNDCPELPSPRRWTCNLFPQPMAGAWGARVKDGLEHHLAALVCRGVVPLEEAQALIAHDWIEAWRRWRWMPLPARVISPSALTPGDGIRTR